MPPAPAAVRHSHDRKCAFCSFEDVDNEHREVCLQKHINDVQHRQDRDLAREGLVRIKTCGAMLGLLTLDIPLKKINGEPGALRREIWWRIQHCFDEQPGFDDWELSAFRTATGNNLVDCDGQLLKAGEVVEVIVSGDSKEDGDAQNADVTIDATPDVDVLGATDHFESRKNRVGYLISEFVDNSLMALSTPSALKRRRVCIQPAPLHSLLTVAFDFARSAQV